MAMHKKRILVVGCGQHARMTIDNIEDQGQYTVFGLTTHLDEELNQKIYGYSVVCKDAQIEDLLKKNPDIQGYVLGVGHCKTRFKLYPWLDKFLEPVNIIHPAALISKHARIGKGNS